MAGGEVCRNPWVGITGGDQPVEIDNVLDPMPVDQLYDERQDGDRDDAVVDEGICLRLIGIAKRYHCALRLAKSLETVNEISCLPSRP